MSRYEIQLTDTCPIALVPEGPAESTYLNILLDGDCLRFARERLLNEQVLSHRYRKAINFQRDFLGFTYEEQLLILLVQDRLTTYKIKKPYNEKINRCIHIITSPEIEMLMIHHFGLYNEFKKSDTKRKGGIMPSVYLAEQLGKKASIIKSCNFIKDTFSADSLVNAINEHYKKSQRKSREYHLRDLLRN